ncbi:UDP-N-acetyl glucosamine 2-epimerase [Sphingomonas melonis TY]|uniref:UDP-N-acetylglucosamine 2-epimerase (non-hydrolyzing) n=1 Tax=Sphingomonas melonis TY TaxID=621456 RepID=A0A175Y367_9SPHN|nr:UDP-N-acetylglucosamine 2-epimerase (non-hydrolyzing) [Sphingomonas melonis]AOW24542.1 UDP-N-acetylglucosamine 2-epimerase [Sphingomonas melonis TY]KZB94998.1 UDP-N-acetyl glucosamine 2-epimerase [Sphingomonas melonis TY]
MTVKKKVMLAFGTRPEAIKMAPVYHALKARDDAFDLICCVTAQHRHMLDQVLETFEIVPDIDLDLMRAGQDLTDVTTSVLQGMRDVLRQHRPDIVLVHGDTTTTMATSLACFYANIAVGHVEAGLRTFDLRAPFPEEFNRRLTGMLTQWHFAPTETSRANLLREGVDPASIVVTGNTVIDALLFVLERFERSPERRATVEAILDEVMEFDWRRDRFVLITGHRRENFGDGFRQICEALGTLSETYPDVHFVYPVHLNPNVREPVNTYLTGRPNVHLIEPLTYEPFVYALKHSHIVLTDSGGIQEEAPSLGKPVLVMRDVTERPEAVEAGTVRLVGAHRDRIIAQVGELLADTACYERMSLAHNPYGDGHAAARIGQMLEPKE